MYGFKYDYHGEAKDIFYTIDIWKDIPVAPELRAPCSGFNK